MTPQDQAIYLLRAELRAGSTRKLVAHRVRAGKVHQVNPDHWFLKISLLILRRQEKSQSPCTYYFRDLSRSAEDSVPYLQKGEAYRMVAFESRFKASITLVWALFT